MRVEEPFLKTHLALWCVSKGAREITLSVDGGENHPEAILELLTEAGYGRTPLRGRPSDGRGCIWAVSRRGFGL